MGLLYPLASTTWDDAEREAIRETVSLDRFTMGEKVQTFEQDFCKYIGSRYAVMCSSGSTANLIMIAALFYTIKGKLKRGDEVIVPAVSWSTTYYPLYQYGLKLKFVDVDIDTLNFNLEDLKSAVSENTRAILAVNLLGNPNDFNEIQKIIAGRDIILLEDNCESMGAVYRGRQAGTFGIMGTFSTFFSHHMATMEGGFVVTDDEELYHILLCLRAHGWTRNLPKHNRVTGTKSDFDFDESFKFVLPGYNVRPLEMAGAIGIRQLKKLPGFVSERQENARVFQELFCSLKGVRTQKEIGSSSWFGFSFVLNGDANSRRDVVEHLIRNGVECRPIVAGNFAKNEVVKYFDYEIHGQLKNAERIDKWGFFIGNHHYSVKTELAGVRDILAKALGE